MKGIIQIGAHYGEELEGWISLGIKNFILFEPVMVNFMKLQRIVANKPGVILHNIAIGNMDGMIKMFTEQSHQGKSCSILEPLKHLEQYPDIEFKTSEMVRIKRLDDIPFNRSLYDYLHIDTQGYELEVLKGAEESLKYIKTIQVEVYREELYRGCPMIDDITGFLKEFKLKKVYWRGLSWGDAIYKRI